MVDRYPSPLVDGYKNLDVTTHYRAGARARQGGPGVTAAAFSTFRPEAARRRAIAIGRANTPREVDRPQAEWAQVSPGFFETLGIPMLRGRDFTYSDGEKSPKVAIISATLERQLFGEGRDSDSTSGCRARPEWQDAEVVGMVSDGRVFDVRGATSRDHLHAGDSERAGAAHYKCLIARAPEYSDAELREAIESFGVELMRRMANARLRARPHDSAGAALAA